MRFIVINKFYSITAIFRKYWRTQVPCRFLNFRGFKNLLQIVFINPVF